MSYGSRIGRIEKSGTPLTRQREDDVRFQAGRLLLETVISGVLAGAGRKPVRVGGIEDGLLFDDLFAQPPLEDAEEAARLGSEITALRERYEEMFPHTPLRTEEVDKFIIEAEL